MSASASTRRPPELDPVFRAINATRALLRTSWVLTGLVLTAGVGLIGLALAAGWDLAWPMFSEWLRLTALVLVVIPPVWTLIHGVVRPLLRRLSPRHVARRIERHVHDEHDRLVSCVDLSGPRHVDDRSKPFFQRLVQEALVLVAKFRLGSVIDRGSLRTAILYLLAGLFALGGMYLALPDRLPTTLLRILMPFADIPPATGVLFSVEPGDRRIARGDDLTLETRLTKGAADKFRVRIQEPGAEVRWAAMGVDDEGRWTLPLEALDKSLSYRVFGGGTWSREFNVTVLDRPVINRLHTVLTMPEYMGMPDPIVGAMDDAEIRGPEGSKAEVVVRATGDISVGEIQFVREERQSAGPDREVVRTWFSDGLPDRAQAKKEEWKWHGNIERRKAHSNEFGDGLKRHKLQNAEPTFEVRKADILYADVFIPKHNPPKQIMIAFQAKGWEHRAFWGEDQIPLGQRGKPSRKLAGPLPETGAWVRLEVPAAELGLEGQQLRGVEFLNVDGEAYWSSIGAVERRKQEKRVWTVLAREPMTRRESVESADPTMGAEWGGSFKLTKPGFYRIVLKNELDIENQPMAPAAIRVDRDRPPMIRLEKPASDITVSQPKKIPLLAVAEDDFALRSVQVSVQRTNDGPFEAHGSVSSFDKPLRSATVPAEIDLAELDLKNGQEIRYRMDAVDRKGQIGQTRVYKIRLQNDYNSADQKLERLLEEQKKLEEELQKRLAEQSRINAELDKLKSEAEKRAAEAAKNDPNNQAKNADAAKNADSKNTDAAKADSKNAASKDAEKNSDQAKAAAKNADGKPEANPAAELDAKEKQKLRELSEAQARNAELANQLATKLEDNAEEAQKNPLMPANAADRMMNQSQKLKSDGSQEMKKLSDQMKGQSESPKANSQQVQQDADKGQEIKEDLQKLLDQMKGLREAASDLANKPAEAMARLDQEVKRQEAEQALDELGDLRNFAGQLRGELNDLAKRNADAASQPAPKPDPAAAKNQPNPADPNAKPTDLAGRTEKALSTTRKLLDVPDRANPADQPGENNPAKNEGEPGDTPPADAPPSDPQGQQPGMQQPEFKPALGGQPEPENSAGSNEAAPEQGQPGGAKPDQGANPAGQPEAPNTRQPGAMKDGAENPGGNESRPDAAGKDSAPGQPSSKAASESSPSGKAAGAPQPNGNPPAGKADGKADGQGQPGQPANPQAAKAAQQAGSAGRALGTDLKTLDRLTEELGKAMSDESPANVEKKQKLMQSGTMQDALDMAGRMREMTGKSQPGQQGNNRNRPNDRGRERSKAPGGTDPNRFGPEDGAVFLEGLGEVDSKTKQMLLKLPPQVREELLQGAREQGPDGYRDYIKEYFLKLARAKQ